MLHIMVYSVIQMVVCVHRAGLMVDADHREGCLVCDFMLGAMADCGRLILSISIYICLLPGPL